MKHLGSRLASSTGKTAGIVSQTIVAVILLIATIKIGNQLSEYRDLNYFGSYDDDIRTFNFLLILSYIGMASSALTAFAIFKQEIVVYERVVSGTARKTMWTNRIVEIDYKDIRDVSASYALVIVRTGTDEIHFCVNDSEYIAGQIRYQWNKHCNQPKNSMKRKPEQKEQKKVPTKQVERPNHVISKRDDAPEVAYAIAFHEDTQEAYFKNCYSEFVFCPACNTRQKSTRNQCLKCNAEFVYEYDDE